MSRLVHQNTDRQRDMTLRIVRITISPLYTGGDVGKMFVLKYEQLDIC